MKKKWRRPTRLEARVIIQYWLLEIMTGIGFSTVYLIMLRLAGVQNGLWAEVISVICGCLSTFGLDRWIRGSDYKPPVITKVETNIFDKEEIYENCTVQVLTNTVTGEVSVGWWKNED